MKFTAIAYDTQSREPREILKPRFFDLSDGRPKSVMSENGLRYKEFELHITLDDGTLIKYDSR